MKFWLRIFTLLFPINRKSFGWMTYHSQKFTCKRFRYINACRMLRHADFTLFCLNLTENWKVKWKQKTQILSKVSTRKDNDFKIQPGDLLKKEEHQLLRNSPSGSVQKTRRILPVKKYVHRPLTLRTQIFTNYYTQQGRR